MEIKLPVMFVKNTASLFFIFFFTVSFGQQPDNQIERLSLLFMGDIMGHDTQILAAETGKEDSWDYNDVFTYVRPLISDADIAIANLEVTLAGPPYKGYPQFSSPAALADACKNAGIDLLVTANNHSADRREKGIEGTIDKLDSMGINHTGTFKDQASRDSLYPVIISRNGFRIALLNYTYGTNGIRVNKPFIVNMLDRDIIAADIQKAKDKNAEFVILYLHWGNEYDTVPSPYQAALARYFFNCGTDLIIGSHPHVLQKMIWYKDDTANSGKAIFYSIGNFVSNQRKQKTDGGSMIRVEIEKTGLDTKIINAGYYLTWVYTPVENNRKRFYILPCSEFEKQPEFFNNYDDYLRMKKFISGSRVLLKAQNLNVSEYIDNRTKPD